MSRRAWLSRGLGGATLVGYLFLYSIAASGGHEAVIGPVSSSADTRFLLYESVMLLLYVMFFSLLTRSFVLLGLLEYLAIED